MFHCVCLYFVLIVLIFMVIGEFSPYRGGLVAFGDEPVVCSLCLCFVVFLSFWFFFVFVTFVVEVVLCNVFVYLFVFVCDWVCCFVVLLWLFVLQIVSSFEGQKIIIYVLLCLSIFCFECVYFLWLLVYFRPVGAGSSPSATSPLCAAYDYCVCHCLISFVLFVV